MSPGWVCLVVVVVAACGCAATVSKLADEDGTLTATADKVLFKVQGCAAPVDASAICKNTDDIAIVSAKADQAQSSISTINSSLSDVSAGLDALKSITQAPVQTIIPQLQADVAALQSNATEQEKHLTYLDSMLSTAQSDVGTLQTDVSSLQGDVGTAKGDISSIKQKNTDQQGQIDGISGKITQALSDITDLKANASNQESRIVALETTVQSLVSAVSSIESAVTELQTAVTHIQNNFTAFVAPRATCRDHYNAGLRESGLYVIQPSSKHPAFDVYCDMSSEGWTLVGMVHTANKGGVNEPNDWFVAGLNAGHALLLQNQNSVNSEPMSHGAARFVNYVDQGESLLRIVVHAELNLAFTNTIYKEVNGNVLKSLFATTTQYSSKACLDRAMTQECFTTNFGTTAGGQVTNFNGFSPRIAEGATTKINSGSMHMRQNNDAEGSGYSGICSGTGSDSRWPDAAIDGHWGNGMRVWLL